MRHLLFIALTSQLLSAQNLIKNPSFEDYDSCPSGFGQVGLLSNWSVPSATTGTPDFFHICGNNVPDNAFGSQSPYAGRGYTGLIAYADVNDNRREYIQTRLDMPLEAGAYYEVSFFASRADYCRYAANELGAYFSNTPLNGSGNTAALNLIPHVSSAAVISDADGWTEVWGLYQATGGEEYITFGNFYNDNEVVAVEVNTNPTLNMSRFAYYYIDMVSVTPSTLNSETFNRQDGISLFPNPVTTELTIGYPRQKGITGIELYSAHGFTKKIVAPSDRIDFTSLASGVYFLVFLTADEQKIVKKVVKR